MAGETSPLAANRGGVLTSGQPRSVHRHLDGSVQGGDLGGGGQHVDGEGEALTWTKETSTV